MTSSSTAIICATDLCCKRGHFTLFEPVSFALNNGQSLLVSGANGIGKTTLLESMASLRALHQGSLCYKNQDITSNSDQWLDNIFFLGHKTGNKKELSCLENLRTFLQIQGLAISLKQAQKALAEVGLAGYDYQLAGNMSAGQKKRLALARLLLVKFPIWILDEPFVNLDSSGCQWLLELLTKHCQNKGILIITAHDNKTIKQSVTHELMLKAAAI